VQTMPLAPAASAVSGDDAPAGDESRKSASGARLSSTLKTTCEPCTRAKAKCSGGKPCERCADRDPGQCEYRLRFKRGPPPVIRTDFNTPLTAEQAGLMSKVVVVDSMTTPVGEEDVVDWEEAPAFVQRAGRIAWRVFFSAYAAAAQQNFNLAWYRIMILRLHAHLCNVNLEAAAVLRAWIDKRRVRLLPGDLKLQCPLAPEICTYCASRALGMRGQPGALMPPEKAPALGLGLPTLELHLTATNMEHASGTFSVNAAFVQTFGVSAEELEGLVSWTGASGMLPWGCDAFAALFASELDVALLMHAVAAKFYIAAEESPGVHSVLVAIMAKVRLANNSSAQCLVRAWYREKRNREACFASMEGVVTFEPLIAETAPPSLPPLPTAWEASMLSLGSSAGGSADDDTEFLLDLLADFDDEPRPAG